MFLELAFALVPHLVPLPAAPAADAVRWGRIGHRVVARVAAGMLSERAHRELRLILEGNSLARISTWADSIRRDRPETAPWHYVNIPIIDSVFRREVHCRPTCIVQAAESQVAILRDERQPRERRTEALKWVIHLIGDMHMPLHAGDRDDRGGNDVVVWFRWQRTNLHALWDSGIIESTGVSEDELVTLLASRVRERQDLAAIRAGSIADWTLASHNVARDLVYPRLSPWLIITQGYVEAATPVIEEQLLRAAVRLAAVLNEAVE